MCKVPGFCKCIINCLVSQAVLGTLPTPSLLMPAWTGCCLMSEVEGWVLHAADRTILAGIFLKISQTSERERTHTLLLRALALLIVLVSAANWMIFWMVFAAGSW